MNLTLDGGTARQRQWVMDALAASSYPYDKLDVPLTVTWAPTTPCGLQHTYMCTSEHSDGSFTITITSDADNPDGPNAAGLPNPAADIKRFYMESFIHETGHVAHYALINNDGLRTQAAALFWTAAVNNTARRYGALSDYSNQEVTGIMWADAIVEAIAESFKCAFYRGELLYGNRTVWHIDEKNWDALTSLLLPGGGLEEYIVGPSLGVLTGALRDIPLPSPPSFAAGGAAGGLVGQVEIDDWILPAPQGIDGGAWVQGYVSLGLLEQPGGKEIMSSLMLGEDQRLVPTYNHVAIESNLVDSGVVDASTGNEIPWPDLALGVLPDSHSYRPPWWLRCVIADDQKSYATELWTQDFQVQLHYDIYPGQYTDPPALVGQPRPNTMLVARWTRAIPDELADFIGTPFLALGGWNGSTLDVTDAVQFDIGPVQWGHTLVKPKGPPYPYAALAGAAQIGPGTTGMIAVH